MNPLDFLLFFFSFVAAVMAVAANGFTLSGIGPAVIALAGGALQLWMSWLRHRSWLRHVDSGFAPGTQHLAMAGTFGWAASIVAAMIWTIVVFKSRLP